MNEMLLFVKAVKPFGCEHISQIAAIDSAYGNPSVFQAAFYKGINSEKSYFN